MMWRDFDGLNSRQSNRDRHLGSESLGRMLDRYHGRQEDAWKRESHQKAMCDFPENPDMVS